MFVFVIVVGILMVFDFVEGLVELCVWLCENVVFFWEWMIVEGFELFLGEYFIVLVMFGDVVKIVWIVMEM